MPRIQRSGEGLAPWSEACDQEVVEDPLCTPKICTRILDGLRALPGETLLDVGCGNGLLLAEALVRKLNPTGLEASPESAAISLKTAAQAQVVLGSSQEIPFDSDSFDVATCLDLSQYFATPQEGLPEIQRVLKPGGRAAFLLANADFCNRRPAGQDFCLEGMHYPLREWKRMLEESGLHLAQVEAESGNHTFRRWLSGLWRWLPKKYIRHYLCFCHKKA